MQEDEFSAQPEPEEPGPEKPGSDTQGPGTQEPGTPGPHKARPAPPREFGGPAGPEPTRYGDWEQKGRCTDF